MLLSLVLVIKSCKSKLQAIWYKITVNRQQWSYFPFQISKSTVFNMCLNLWILQTENRTYGTKANSDGTIKSQERRYNFKRSQQAQAQHGTAANTTQAEGKKQLLALTVWRSAWKRSTWGSLLWWSVVVCCKYKFSIKAISLTSRQDSTEALARVESSPWQVWKQSSPRSWSSFSPQAVAVRKQ